MTYPLPPPTRLSLINRLRAGKGEKTVRPDWEEFYAIYCPVIHNWCRRSGLQAADADDVAQGVVLKLFQAALQSYRLEEGRFSNWLGTVVRHAVLDFLRGAGRRPRPLDQAQLEALQSVGSLTALKEELEQAPPTEFERYQEIVSAVQARVQPRTWKAFVLHKLEGHSAVEVARELGFSEDSVYVACNRVLKKLREEKAKMLDHP